MISNAIFSSKFGLHFSVRRPRSTPVTLPSPYRKGRGPCLTEFAKSIVCACACVCVCWGAELPQICRNTFLGIFFFWGGGEEGVSRYSVCNGCGSHQHELCISSKRRCRKNLRHAPTPSWSVCGKIRKCLDRSSNKHLPHLHQTSSGVEITLRVQPPLSLHVTRSILNTRTNMTYCLILTPKIAGGAPLC